MRQLDSSLDVSDEVVEKKRAEKERQEQQGRDSPKEGDWNEEGLSKKKI